MKFSGLFRFAGHCVFVLLYVSTAWLGMKFVNLPPGNLTLIWLPSGIALAVLMIAGRRMLPAVWIASLIANLVPLWNSESPEVFLRSAGVGVVIAAVDVLQPYLALVLIERTKTDQPFSSGSGFLKFILLAVIPACLATAWMLVLTLQLGGLLPTLRLDTFLWRSLSISLADALGMFVVVPAVYAFHGFRLDDLRTGRVRDAAILVLLLAVSSWLTFHHFGQIRYLAIPLLLFVAIRGGLRGASVGLLVLSLYAIIATSRGMGPFVESDPVMSFVTIITYLICLGLPAFFAAITWEELVHHRETLENRVQERTHELQSALTEIKTLRGILPICSGCKKIRDDQGYWNRLETYITEHSGAEFSHGLCPDCAVKLYPAYVDKKTDSGGSG